MIGYIISKTILTLGMLKPQASLISRDLLYGSVLEQNLSLQTRGGFFPHAPQQHCKFIHASHFRTHF